MTPAQFYALEQNNQQNRQQFMQGQMNNVMSGLAGLAQTYSDNKAMEAKAKSYDKVGEILGSSMFSGNSVAMNALGELKKSKDPREKVMGYEALLSFAGPYSNFMNAQGRMGIQQNAPILNAGLQGAARVAGGEGTVPLPEEPLPVMDNSQLPPSQTSQPSPDAMSAATAWYNQSNRGMMQTGTMKPFYRN
jgi:hypothetical protein